MAMPLRVRLNEEERVKVEWRYTTARDAETRTRYQMVPAGGRRQVGPADRLVGAAQREGRF